MVVDSIITLAPGELSRGELTKLFKGLTFLDNDSTEVTSYRILKNGKVKIPRGAWSLLPNHVEYQDGRVLPARGPLTFNRALDYSGPERSFSGQQAALDAMLAQEQGQVIAQPGFGKTTVALAFLVKANTPGIVFVHTEDLFQQWVKDATELTNAKVGQIQGSRWRIGDITIAMIQTVRNDLSRYRSIVDKFGALVIDEEHHAPASSWEVVLNVTPAHYRFGFSATKTRADGLHPLTKALVGPIIFEQKFESKIPVQVVPVKNPRKYLYRGRYDWTPMLASLKRDNERNKKIAETAARQVTKGHSTLILSRHIDHLNLIGEELQALGTPFKVLTGSTPRPKRKAMLDQYRAGKFKLLLSTQLMDEGVDVPRLSRVLLTFPGKHDGRIIQQVGRALREHPDKSSAIIFDFVDDKTGVLRRQWMERKKAYSKMGIPVKKLKGEVEHARTEKEERRNVADRIRDRARRGRGGARRASIRNRRARRDDGRGVRVRNDTD